jgi:AbrB family looped-hinge helix DNA binding protein
MTVTIDAAGRLVIPKQIREEAEIDPGTPLEISVRDGVIEIAPKVTGVRLVRKHGWLVAEPIEPGPPLTKQRIDREIRKVRNERIADLIATTRRPKQSRRPQRQK